VSDGPSPGTAAQTFARAGGGHPREERGTHEVGERGGVEAEGEEGGVGLHVDLGAAADGVEPPHRDVALVAEAEADYVQHGGGGRLPCLLYAVVGGERNGRLGLKTLLDRGVILLNCCRVGPPSQTLNLKLYETET
jgi:hypothetical protein